jgi:hypothetical protein
MKPPIATDAATGTTREQSCGYASFLELLGVSDAVFPDEETERERLIAVILKNKRKA